MKYREEENSLSKIENSQKIKILITGGSGFIGSRLLRNLIRKKKFNGKSISNQMPNKK